jgi:hypothetical protein
VIRLPRSILNGGQNVLALKVRIVLEYLGESGTCTEQFKHVAHPNSHAPNARTPPTLRTFDSYPAEAIWRHDVFLQRPV